MIEMPKKLNIDDIDIERLTFKYMVECSLKTQGCSIHVGKNNDVEFKFHGRPFAFAAGANRAIYVVRPPLDDCCPVCEGFACDGCLPWAMSRVAVQYMIDCENTRRQMFADELAKHTNAAKPQGDSHAYRTGSDVG